MSHPIRNIQPFFVMEILARANELEHQGRDIIHLEIGEPDFPTPPLVIKAVTKFLEHADVHYTAAPGLPQLRCAIAGFYRERYGVQITPNRVFVTPGASGAFLILLSMLVGHGDRILLSDPGYPCYANLVRLFGGTVAAVPVDSASCFHPTLDRVASLWSTDTRGTILASPSNPTGTVITPELLESLIQFFHERGGFFIADEIYHGLEYSGSSPTALAYSDEAFVVNSFSKYFGMTGWRVGWMVIPERYIAQAESLAQNLFISAPLPSQIAALAALSPDSREEWERRRNVLAKRRDILVAGLIELGFAIPILPQGAFYVYADCSAHTEDSHAFALEMLERAGVAITPGRDFGSHFPECYVRFSLTAPTERIREALIRFRTFLAT